jgi:hypothetical protein
MVWRDLDVIVVCPRLDVDAVVQVGSRFALHPRIREVVFRNDTGVWNTNTNPTYPDGLYLGSASRIARRTAMTGRATSGLSMNQPA